MGTLNVTTGQLARVVDGLLHGEKHGLDLRGLGAVPRDLLAAGVAAAANVIIGYLASGGVTPIGPPKKKLTKLAAYGNKPGRNDDLVATGGVKPIGPPKLDVFVARLIKGRSPVPRMYPDLSAWVEVQIPKELHSTYLCVAAAQFRIAATWADDELKSTFNDAADQLFGAAFGS